MIRQTQAERILEFLKEREEGGVTNVELNRDLGIFRYGARIFDLRRRGYDIASRRLRNGMWKFVLDSTARKSQSFEAEPTERAEERRPSTAFDPLHGRYVEL